MKLKQVIALFGSVLVFILSTGLTINKMECLMSGKASYSVYDVNGCCDTDCDDVDLSATCCALSELTLLKSFDFFEVAKNIEISLPVLMLDIPFGIEVVPMVQSVDFRNNSPPGIIHKSVLDYLSIVQVFRL